MHEMTQEQMLQQWIEDFVDMYNKQPSEETMKLWEYQIWELHFNEDDE